MTFIRQINSKLIFILIISAFALVLAACSPPAEKLVQDGNQAFTEQAYLESLELYQSAQVESPELAEPYFNAANALYRQGDFPAAMEQMQMALQYVDEESLAESSYYNLGNTLFNSQDLQTAIEAYTQALLLNPDDQDAKYNLELALQQQEQQNQQQQQEQNQEQNEDSQGQSQEQEGDGQESEDEENNQNQGSDQSSNNEQQDREQENEGQNGSGDPQEGEEQPDQQPNQVPQPGQRMTEEQARQLLAAITNDMQTLQEKLGQYLFAQRQPPAQDW